MSSKSNRKPAVKKAASAKRVMIKVKPAKAGKKPTAAPLKRPRVHVAKKATAQQITMTLGIPTSLVVGAARAIRQAGLVTTKRH